MHATPTAKMARMKPALHVTCLTLALVVMGLGNVTAQAQALAVPDQAARHDRASTAAHLADTQPKSVFPEPKVREQVTQDRAVRIQEQQVRGATTEIQVHPLHGGANYNIVPPDVSSSTDPANMQGRMQWTIGTFR